MTQRRSGFFGLLALEAAGLPRCRAQTFPFPTASFPISIREMEQEAVKVRIYPSE
jgi:hypothetical protein